jgi:hypothetical protein
MNSPEILAKQHRHLWPNHILYYSTPLPWNGAKACTCGTWKGINI